VAEQLTFDLTRRPALQRGDFFVSPSNATAVATVDGWQAWPSGKLVLVGPAAAGKTHLAHVWAAQTGASLTAARDLPGADIAALARGAVVVEDAETVAGEAAAETALFHLHNLVLAEGHPLLLTAARPPSAWPLGLPDLASRMQATATAHLQPPDDSLLAAVLMKQLAERQLEMDPEVLSFCIARMERRFETAARLAAELNRAAYSKRRRVTKPLVREVLDRIAEETP
jgi:DnaA regulatory inactivator Hda